MSSSQHDATAAAIAAAVQEDLGLPLPVTPTVLCTAYGWRERVGGYSEDGDIVTLESDSPAAVQSKLALAAAQRLAREAGHDAPPWELVLALAERLCGPGVVASARSTHSAMRFAMGS